MQNPLFALPVAPNILTNGHLVGDTTELSGWLRRFLLAVDVCVVALPHVLHVPRHVTWLVQTRRACKVIENAVLA